MTDRVKSDSGRTSEREVVSDFSSQPHAYDPGTQAEYFEGVLGRRSMAFLFDFAIVLFLWLVACVFLAIAGIITLGLAWLLFGIAFPAVALGYSALTMSRPSSSTIGMRMFDLQIRTWYGDRMNGMLGAFHTLVYYFSVTFLTPVILLLPFFNDRKRCLHDYLTGTVVINSEMRADMNRDAYRR
jgi:uncharacterized RDD family membrane protein YckC